MTYQDTWRTYLERAEIKGALPVRFEILDNRVRCNMLVPDVESGDNLWVFADFELPPFSLSEDAMRLKVYEWTRWMYLHEMREQFYLDGARVDVPEDEH